ncbi:histone deacetylase family protein [Sphingobacterium yanglingense]|uniref:Acetoin utilization deacetylase AcuC-like enzyme n=1 Tax=Sphingobacterium yanglingense TaxID=1437280 RepID=A0A4R6WED6_9SPHI|nr:histone deacetylase [Sphingobacterium yanglingense]TDQ78159.1 acetoin utilization deacetylase AcuC-like enzyme [Sphingobacterium yanglingense]
MLKIAHHTKYVHPVREGHRFPMLKYELIPEQLCYEGLVSAVNFFEPEMVDFETAALAHDVDYLRRLFDLTLDAKMVRRIGFPLSQELVERERYLVDGTLKSALFALEYGISFNVAGGTHHAGRNFGEGFCLMNDQAIAAAYLLKQGLATRILIIDLDVHQGNGTAHIFEGVSPVYTFSMHGDKNFPFIKERSDRDVALEDGITDDLYLKLLSENLAFLFETVNPDFVFYQAGVDILGSDKLGKLKVSAAGCRERDRMVLESCKVHKVPVQISMGGGYSTQIRDIVNAHVETYRAAIDIFDF